MYSIIAIYNHSIIHGMILRAIFMYGVNKILEVYVVVCILSSFGRLFNAMLLTNFLSTFIMNISINIYYCVWKMEGQN